MDQSPPPTTSRNTPPVVRSEGARWIPWRLVGIYLGFTVVWAIATKLVMEKFVTDEARIARIEPYLNWLFVLLSAGLVVYLLRHHIRGLQRAQAQISASEAHYRRLIETASDAIVVVDFARGNFARHNRRAELLFDATDEQLKRMGPVQLSPELQPDGRKSGDKAFAMLCEAKDGGAPVFEWTHRSLTGRIIPCEIRLLRLPGDNPVLIRGSITDITERRRSQEALRESERQLSLILNNATDMMALCKVEPGGVFRVVSVNRTYLRAINAAGCQATESEVVGRTLQDVNERICGLSPEYNLAKHERFMTVVSSRQVLAYDDFHDTPAGRVYGETVLTPLLDEAGSCTSVLYCSRDVTGQRRAAEALARSEENYRTLFEQATDAIILYTLDGRLADVNKRTVQLTGFSRQELLGREIFQVIAACDHAVLREALGADAVKDDTKVRLFRYECKGGGVFPGETTTRMLPDGRLLAMVRDISERVTAEEQHLRLEKELRQAQKIQAIGTLAGGIAHDFNNILAAVLGNAQLLNMTLPPAHEGQANVAQIIVSSNRAKDLVQQILMFSRQREQSRQLLQLAPLVTEATRLVSVSLPPSTQLSVVLAPVLPDILADPTQMHQVVVNLCTNAMHAMRSSGGTLAVTLGLVSLPEENSRSKPNLPSGRYVALSVSDTGHGMSAETLERIYEPFFTTKPVGEGTGLGLAVVHGIVQSNDGAITVSSKPEKGTTFKLYFPAQHPHVGTAQPWPHRELKPGHGQHIVFVDDEVSITEVARIMLGRLGYRVTVFTDPRQARDFLEGTKEAPNLLLTDLSMPGLSGVELIRLATRRIPEMPAILLTGYGKAFDATSSGDVKIAEIIHKPFTMEQLSMSIEAALPKR